MSKQYKVINETEYLIELCAEKLGIRFMEIYQYIIYLTKALEKNRTRF